MNRPALKRASLSALVSLAIFAALQLWVYEMPLRPLRLLPFGFLLGCFVYFQHTANIAWIRRMVFGIGLSWIVALTIFFQTWILPTTAAEWLLLAAVYAFPLGLIGLAIWGPDSMWRLPPRGRA